MYAFSSKQESFLKQSGISSKKQNKFPIIFMIIGLKLKMAGMKAFQSVTQASQML